MQLRDDPAPLQPRRSAVVAHRSDRARGRPGRRTLRRPRGPRPGRRPARPVHDPHRRGGDRADRSDLRRPVRVPPPRGRAGPRARVSTSARPEDRPGEPGDDPAEPTPPPAPDLRTVPWRAFLGYFLGLGTWGFGGPIASVGYMERDLVERRGWLDRQDFLNGVALGQTMPGPLAAQVAMWVGYLERGPLGALAVAVPFIAPSFLLVLAVAVIYVRYQGLPVVQSLFYGIAPGVMAI